MPFKDYAVLVLIALAAFITWDWLHTRDELASASARYDSNMQAAQDTVRSKDEAIERLRSEAALSQAAVAHAEGVAAAARKKAATLQQQVDDLGNRSPEVREYLDARIPDDLLRQLRPDPGAGADAHAGAGGAAGSEPAATVR